MNKISKEISESFEKITKKFLVVFSSKILPICSTIFVACSDSVMRPSDLFYAKLTPLLKEHGITNLDNRKEWPLSVLVQVLTTLMKETPDNLLAK